MRLEISDAKLLGDFPKISMELCMQLAAKRTELEQLLRNKKVTINSHNYTILEVTARGTLLKDDNGKTRVINIPQAQLDAILQAGTTTRK